MLASFDGHIDIVKLLLSYGAEKDGKDTVGGVSLLSCCRIRD